MQSIEISRNDIIVVSVREKWNVEWMWIWDSMLIVIQRLLGSIYKAMVVAAFGAQFSVNARHGFSCGEKGDRCWTWKQVRDSLN